MSRWRACSWSCSKRELRAARSVLRREESVVCEADGADMVESASAVVVVDDELGVGGGWRNKKRAALVWWRALSDFVPTLPFQAGQNLFSILILDMFFVMFYEYS